MPVGAWELEYGCNVIADPNRVAQYVANAQDPDYCVNGVNVLAPVAPKWSTLRVNCGCDALQWTSSSPTELPTQIPPYNSPSIDGAPWYSASSPESAHFWGWMIEKVEDVANAATYRSVTDRVSTFGGSTLGPLRLRGRTMKFTLIGFGAYEAAMDYGFRWLSDVLTSSHEVCELCDMTFRTSCPQLSDPPTFSEWDQGRWTFKNVGLVDGPRYEDPPNSDMGCNIRRVSFTVVAEIPYAYKCPTTWVTDQQWITELWAPGDEGCPPLDWICTPEGDSFCVTITPPYEIGDDVLMIEVFGGREGVVNLTITVTPNPFGYTCGDPSLGPACDTVVVPYLSAGHTLIYDGTTQSIMIRHSDGTMEDGTFYINSGNVPPTFPSIRSGSFCVCVTSDRCSWETNAATFSLWTVHRELVI